MRLTKDQIKEINNTYFSDQGIGFNPNGIELYHDIYSPNANFKDEPVIYMLRFIGGYYSFGEDQRGYYYGSRLENYIDEGWESFVVLSEVLKILKPNLSYLHFEEISKLIKKRSFVEDNKILEYGEYCGFMSGDNSSHEGEIKYVFLSELYVLLERLTTFEQNSLLKQDVTGCRNNKPFPIEANAAGYYGRGNKEFKPMFKDEDLLFLLKDLDQGHCAIVEETLENFTFDAIQGSLLKQRGIYPLVKNMYVNPKDAIIDASESLYNDQSKKSGERFVCLVEVEDWYIIQIGDNKKIISNEKHPHTKDGFLAALDVVRFEINECKMRINRIMNADLERLLYTEGQKINNQLDSEFE